LLHSYTLYYSSINKLQTQQMLVYPVSLSFLWHYMAYYVLMRR